MNGTNGRDSASCEKLRRELNEALRTVDDEGSLDVKVKILRSFVFGHGLAVLEHISRIYRRLPRRPWIINLLGSVSLVGLLGLAFAGGALNHQVKSNTEAARKAREEAALAASGTIASNAKLDMLLDARDLGRPTTARLRAMRARLGFPRDSTDKAADTLSVPDGIEP